MNCEKCQEMVSDLIDGSLSRSDELSLNQHLEACLSCTEVRNDLQSILGFCVQHRGEYEAPPNEKALWLRIRNTLEAELVPAGAPAISRKRGWSEWLNRSWELSLPQLAASVSAIVLVVALTTIVGLRRWETRMSEPSVGAASAGVIDATPVSSRTWQQQQAISYWNQRIEVNRVRWSQDMRDTFDRNMKVIDQAVNDSMSELNRNPHDEISAEMLNAALNEKLALLKEFSDLD